MVKFEGGVTGARKCPILRSSREAATGCRRSDAVDDDLADAARARCDAGIDPVDIAQQFGSDHLAHRADAVPTTTLRTCRSRSDPLPRLPAGSTPV